MKRRNVMRRILEVVTAFVITILSGCMESKISVSEASTPLLLSDKLLKLVKMANLLVVQENWLNNNQEIVSRFLPEGELTTKIRFLFGQNEQSIQVRIFWQWDGQGFVPVFFTIIQGEKELAYFALIWSSEEGLKNGITPTIVSINFVQDYDPRSGLSFEVLNKPNENIKLQFIFRRFLEGVENGVISRLKVEPLEGKNSIPAPKGTRFLRFWITN